MYLPRDRVYIPELDVTAVVVGVYLSAGNTEYKLRWFKDELPVECYLYDFEVAGRKPEVNA
jgi:hypothetical protein